MILRATPPSIDRKFPRLSLTANNVSCKRFFVNTVIGNTSPVGNITLLCSRIIGRDRMSYCDPMGQRGDPKHGNSRDQCARRQGLAGIETKIM